MTHDTSVVAKEARLASGVMLAVASAVTFGISGSFASALFATGWSPGTTALVRSAIGAVIALPFGLGGASAVIHRPVLLIPAAGVAMLSSVLSYSLELSALRRIPTSVFGVLMSLEPAAAALAGFVVLGQGLGVREVAAMLMVSLASLGVTLGRPAADPPPEPVLEPAAAEHA